MLSFTSAFSNYRYALLFRHQDSLAFKEAHICFFEHTGGVYQQMVYDNMRVAIASFVGKTEKIPSESLLQLSRWYRYQWWFCNIARGNEKGHVERSVEYIRRKVFGFKDSFISFAARNSSLELSGFLGKGHTSSIPFNPNIFRWARNRAAYSEPHEAHLVL